MKTFNKQEYNKLCAEFYDKGMEIYCFIQGKHNLHRARIKLSEIEKYKKKGYTRFDIPSLW